MASLKVDENLPLEATILFQQAGFDAMSVHDQKLAGAADDAIIDVCLAEQRVLVTLDLDFADVRTFQPERFFGLIVLRLARQDKGHVTAVIGRLISQLKRDDDLAGKLWIMTENQLRIRG